MKKNRKFLLVGLLVVGFTVLGLGGYKHASAATYSNVPGVCNSFDDSHFPYGFLCSGLNHDDYNVPDITANWNVNKDGSSDNKEVTITTGFEPTGQSRISPSGVPGPYGKPAGYRPPVLVWIYAFPTNGLLNDASRQDTFDMGPSDLPSNAIPSAGISTVNDANGTPVKGVADYCPGDGGKGGDSVYAFTDQGDNNYSTGLNLGIFNASNDIGRDVSPDNDYNSAGTMLTTEGVVNCHDAGLIVRWYLPGGVNGGTGNYYKDAFKFTLDLNHNITAGSNKNIQFREIISVAYPTDNQNQPGCNRIPAYAGFHGLFPPVVTPAYPSSGNKLCEQDYVANHLAKQGNPSNISARKPLPPPCTGPCGGITQQGDATVTCNYAHIDADPFFQGYQTKAVAYVTGDVVGGQIGPGNAGNSNPDTSTATTSASFSTFPGDPNVYDASGGKTMNYIPNQNSDAGIKLYVQKYYFYVGPNEAAPLAAQYSFGAAGHRQNNRWYMYQPFTLAKTGGGSPCYDAQCIINLDTDLPGYATPGSTVFGTVTIINAGAFAYTPLRGGLSGAPLLAASPPGGNPLTNNLPPIRGNIEQGENSDYGGVPTLGFSFTAPTTGGTQTVTMQAAYALRFWFGTPCTATYNVYPPTAVNLDDAICGATIDGWAFSPASPGTSITVDLYVDGGASPFGSYPTNVTRNDVNAAYGITGDHGFSIPMPPQFEDANNHTFRVVARDPSGISAADTSSATINISPLCRPFHYTPIPTSDDGGNDEDPSQVTFADKTGLTYCLIDGTNCQPNGAPPPCVNNTTISYTTYRLRGGVKTPIVAANPAAAPEVPRCVRDETDPYGTYNIPPNSVQAGDQFCIDLQINPGSGFIDSGGTRVGKIGPASHPAPACVTVVNEPYFKVTGKGISAGGGFGDAASDNSCTGNASNNGELAAYNNTGAQATGFQFGAGSQLSAIALVKIVGFASGQTVATRNAPNGLGDDLSFANNPANVSAGAGISQKLGGGFGLDAGGNLTGQHCLTDITPASPLVAGPVTYGGGYPGLTAGTNTNDKSLYVNGDIYITSAINYPGAGSYDPTNPAASTVPSAVIKARGGNIYISSSITHLDGVYIAEKYNGTGGNIYTCWDGSSPPSPAANSGNLYANCNNQLTLSGSFIADKINLVRTYGTLRNEKMVITGATSGTAYVAPAGQSVLFYSYYCGNLWGFVGGPLGIHLLSTNAGLTSAICNTPGLEFAIGAVLPDNTNPSINNLQGVANTSAVPIYHAVRHNNGDHFYTTDYNEAAVAGASNSTPNVPDVVGYGFTGPGPGRVAVYSYYDVGSDQHYYTTNGAAVLTPAYREGAGPRFYIYALAGMGGEQGVAFVAGLPGSTAPPVNPGLSCDNNRSGNSARLSTCAAELFDFNPSYYLSNPNVKPPDNGAIHYQAITSLPPVL